MDTKNNIIEKINKLFSVDINKNPEKIFDVLVRIIPFNKAEIYMSEKLLYSKTYSKTNSSNRLKSNLMVKNASFGEIILYRDTKFSTNERKIFILCTSIISNLIKDIELSKIISMQLKALQEGILESDKAYKTEKNKNDFFANFSHELRTPLNSIISSSELLAEEIFGKLNAKQAEYISDIRIAGIHLLGMINDILDMSKIEVQSMKLNKTYFNVDTAFNEVCNIVKPIAQKKKIEIIKHNCNFEIYADYQKIQQILFNLLSNAIKYTPSGGKIELSAHTENNIATISVKDNGIGIDKKYHKKIFNKFVQINSAKDSNGLGLTITKELVKLHGGKIVVISEPQKGSEFIFTIR